MATDFLIDATIFLGAASIAVPICKRLKLGSILGYLAAGVLIGPYALNFIEEGDGLLSFAELGVVLFMFVIGLELNLKRLWSLRRSIFGLGAAQVIVTGGLLAAGAYAFGFSMSAAFVIGFALTLSSTAFALQMLQERRELNSPYGTESFSILLFQDLAVIPLLAIIPLLAVGGGAAAGGGWAATAQGVGVLVAVVLLGKYALNPVFRIVAQSGSREAFAATALCVVAGTAVAVSSAGLSMALGAFVAGVLLADSNFRHQIETDIEPFRGLLLGLFFMSVGLTLNMDVVAAQWVVVIAAAAAVVLVKAAVITAVARLMKVSFSDALRTGAILSQSGEFAFVLFTLAQTGGIFTNQTASILAAIVTVSMAFTPLAVAVANRLLSVSSTSGADGLETPENQSGAAIVVGAGRVGQIVTQMLRNSGMGVTVIDNDPQRIKTAEEFGNKVYFGDGSRLDLLMTAGALSADLVVFCMDDAEAINHAIDRLREACPKVRILARAYDRIHAIELEDRGADYYIRETFESAVRLGAEGLRIYGVEEEMIADVTEEFRRRDRERLLAQKSDGIFAEKGMLNTPFDASAKS